LTGFDFMGFDSGASRHRDTHHSTRATSPIGRTHGAIGDVGDPVGGRLGERGPAAETLRRSRPPDRGRTSTALRAGRRRPRWCRRRRRVRERRSPGSGRARSPRRGRSPRALGASGRG